MQREIKFRAWDLGAKQMYLPADIYGDIRDEIGISLNGDTLFFYESSNGNHCPPSLSTRRATVELMQFTGLLDKNGREIYEGDILEAECPYGEQKKRFVVEFKDGAYQIVWNNMFGGGDCDMTTIGYAMREDFTFEIVGNIYETPNLLTTPDGGK